MSFWLPALDSAGTRFFYMIHLFIPKYILYYFNTTPLYFNTTPWLSAKFQLYVFFFFSQIWTKPKLKKTGQNPLWVLWVSANLKVASLSSRQQSICSDKCFSVYFDLKESTFFSFPLILAGLSSLRKTQDS